MYVDIINFTVLLILSIFYGKKFVFFLEKKMFEMTGPNIYLLFLNSLIKICACLVVCTNDEAKTTTGTCKKCPAGEIQDDVDKTKCRSCAANEAESTPGVCTLCPAGEISHSTDKTKCQNITTTTTMTTNTITTITTTLQDVLNGGTTTSSGGIASTTTTTTTTTSTTITTTSIITTAGNI